MGYGEGLKLLDHGHDPALRAALLSNQSMCLLKLERFADAEKAASMALTADGANAKAVYRRGLARRKLGDERGAVEDFTKASRLDPQNREVRLRLEEAKQAADAA